MPEPIRPAPRTPTLRIAIALGILLFARRSYRLDLDLGARVFGFAAEVAKRQVAHEGRTGERQGRRGRSDDDPAILGPVTQRLPAQAALVQRRHHGVQISGPAGSQV